jgi:RNA polymerase sigma-70 factor (ECF subfamily)
MANTNPGQFLPDLGPSELIASFYTELRRIAAQHFRNERADHTLQPTALVHELFLEWSAHPPRGMTNPAAFFGFAARKMRQILVDGARRRRAKKRAGDWQKIPIDGIDMPVPEMLDYEAIDRALRAFESEHPRAARIVELRIFAGLSSAEIAQLLDMGESTVRADWSRGKVWIQEKIQGEI